MQWARQLSRAGLGGHLSSSRAERIQRLERRRNALVQSLLIFCPANTGGATSEELVKKTRHFFLSGRHFFAPISLEGETVLLFQPEENQQTALVVNEIGKIDWMAGGEE